MIERTRKDAENIINKLGYRLLDMYMLNHHRKVIIQDRVGYKYDCYIDSLLLKRIPNIADKANPYSLENISLWLKLNKPDFSICSGNVYSGSMGKLKFYHNIKECEEVFEMNWNSIQRNGCPICSGSQIGEKTNLAYKFPEIASEWHPVKNENLKPTNVTCFSSVNVWWICVMGHEYRTRVSRRTHQGSGCPMCKSSKGEKKIESFLMNNNIVHCREKTFSSCRDVYLLPFDFGIPCGNGHWKCIEYQGEQHFFPVDFAGRGEQWSKQKHEELKRRDKIKAKYCKNNNISLLIIPYWEYNRIEEILSVTFLQK